MLCGEGDFDQVSSAGPSVLCHAVFLPRHVCDEIDKKCHQFVWGETDGVKKMHLINWKRVCSPKQWGGLGLCTVRNINLVSMMKVGWNLISNKDDMWVEVIRSKYKCGRSPIPIINYGMLGSNFWHGIC